MAEFSFKCPQCGHEITADDSLRGTVAECPYCGKGIVIPPNPKVTMRQRQNAYAEQSAFKKDKRETPRIATENTADNVEMPKRKAWGFIMNNKKSVAIIGFCLAAILIMFGSFRHDDEAFLEVNHKRVDDESCQIMKEPLAMSLSHLRVGVAYVNMDDDFQVVKVIPDEGVMVSCRRSIIFVATKRDYVDGSVMMPGVYVCLGSIRYKDESGSIHTVRSFREMDDALAQERLRQMAEEEAKAEAKRKALAEQARIKRERAEEQARFERQKLELEENVKREKAEAEAKIAREAHERELAKLKAEAEIQKEKDRAEASAKEEAERIKRYPEEQRLRKEYAESKLSVLSFDITRYFDLQAELKKYIRIARPTETLWKELQNLHKAKDWLGMLGKISGKEMKDYPEPNTIDGLLTRLCETEFHMELRWTHRLREICVFRLVSSKNAIQPTAKDVNSGLSHRRRRSFYSDSNDALIVDVDAVEKLEDEEGMVIPFRFDADAKISIFKGYMHDVNPIAKMKDEWREQMSRIEKDQQQGRISTQQYEDAVAKLRASFCEAIQQKMASSTIKLDMHWEKRIK